MISRRAKATRSNSPTLDLDTSELHSTAISDSDSEYQNISIPESLSTSPQFTQFTQYRTLGASHQCSCSCPCLFRCDRSCVEAFTIITSVDYEMIIGRNSDFLSCSVTETQDQLQPSHWILSPLLNLTAHSSAILSSKDSQPDTVHFH